MLAPRSDKVRQKYRLKEKITDGLIAKSAENTILILVTSLNIFKIKRSAFAMKKFAIIKMVLLIGGAALAVTQAFADQRGAGPSWKVEGDTLRVKRGIEMTWDINIQDVENRGRPKTHGFWFRVNRWTNLGVCYVGNEMFVGTRWKPNEDRANASWRFADGSTLQTELIEETVCSVKRPAIGLDFGTWSNRWKVVGGSGRYKGVTGIAEGSGTFDELWDSIDSESASYTGSYKVQFD
ncbi:MAG: hypothetical protein VW840_16525 [Gammaproteobacteria bacterium]